MHKVYICKLAIKAIHPFLLSEKKQCVVSLKLFSTVFLEQINVAELLFLLWCYVSSYRFYWFCLDPLYWICSCEIKPITVQITGTNTVRKVRAEQTGPGCCLQNGLFAAAWSYRGRQHTPALLQAHGTPHQRLPSKTLLFVWGGSRYNHLLLQQVFF